MSNRLAQEDSLYLRQHAENPVDWWPWCPEALEHAKQVDKPLLISIGYSACHWCHVMAHESFEDDYIAGLMNEHFVCIKVDREERPDLDQIYMEAVQMITQHGGWPLNVFCLPDGRPFFGGTYFPPSDKGHGMVPWPQLIMRVADQFQRGRKELVENAEAIAGNLTASNTPFADEAGAFPNEALITAAQGLLRNLDTEHGGFGGAPKFPPSMALSFLFDVRATRACEASAELAGRIDRALLLTLRSMALGGLRDHLGGGFYRYCTDREWVIPHFEKMLYDNALLLELYTRAYLFYREPLFAEVVHELVDWLFTEMSLSEGGYAASLDADAEEGEGRYYVWTPQTVCEVLGKEVGERFCEAYGISEEGNFENGWSNPVVTADAESVEELKEARRHLHAARLKRQAPSRDDKFVLHWNCLLAKALVEAGYYFEEPNWVGTAGNILRRIERGLLGEDGRLKAIAYHHRTRFAATLEDHASFAEACLAYAAKVDHYELGQREHWFERARQSVAVIREHFYEADTGCYYQTAGDQEVPAARKQVWMDNAQPCGLASLAQVLVMLADRYPEEDYGKQLAELRSFYGPMVEKLPTAVPYALSAFTQAAMGLATVQLKDFNVCSGLQKSLIKRPWRRTFLDVRQDPEQPDDYILCIGGSCQKPTWNPHKIADLI